MAKIQTQSTDAITNPGELIFREPRHDGERFALATLDQQAKVHLPAWAQEELPNLLRGSKALGGDPLTMLDDFFLSRAGLEYRRAHESPEFLLKHHEEFTDWYQPLFELWVGRMCAAACNKKSPQHKNAIDCLRSASQQLREELVRRMRHAKVEALREIASIDGWKTEIVAQLDDRVTTRLSDKTRARTASLRSPKDGVLKFWWRSAVNGREVEYLLQIEELSNAQFGEWEELTLIPQLKGDKEDLDKLIVKSLPESLRPLQANDEASRVAKLPVFSGSSSQRERFVERLVKEGLIASDEVSGARALFTVEGEKATKSPTVRWLGTVTLLAYFVTKLKSSGLLSRNLKSKRFAWASRSFCNRDSNIVSSRSISQSEQNYLTNEKKHPRDFEKVDRLFANHTAS